MTEFGFYQLNARPLESVLPKLLEKAYAAGHRIVVRCRSPEQAMMLDERLWTYDDAGFLPHGMEGEGHPILLTTDNSISDGYTLLVLPGGAVSADLTRFSRVLYLFDGNDEAELTQARADWKAAKSNPAVVPVYWKAGEAGRWEKAG